MLNKRAQMDPAISRLIMLRSAAISLQLIVVLGVYFLFDYDLPLLTVLIVIAVEALFQLLSVFAYRNVNQAKPFGIIVQLSADILFLAALLYFSGGATNAFVSLLLLPIMIAAVSVSIKGLIYIALLAISAYSYLLYNLPEHSMHHMDMTHHFITMWINFVLSAVVISVVIAGLNRAIHRREKTIAEVREQQLQKEQLLTLDGAAAQITHQLATPIANLYLLYEELKESSADNEIINEMALPLAQCQTQLAKFRRLSEQLRTNKVDGKICALKLQQQLNEATLLQFPNQHIEFLNQAPECNVSHDAMLLPALLNLIQNAAAANELASQHKIELSWQLIDEQQKLELVIRDHGKGFDQHQLTKLGGQLMPSETGFGMAVMLSNVAFERLSGSLTLYNHEQGGAVAKVGLAIVTSEVDK